VIQLRRFDLTARRFSKFTEFIDSAHVNHADIINKYNSWSYGTVRFLVPVQTLVRFKSYLMQCN